MGGKYHHQATGTTQKRIRSCATSQQRTVTTNHPNKPTPTQGQVDNCPPLSQQGVRPQRKALLVKTLTTSIYLSICLSVSHSISTEMRLQLSSSNQVDVERYRRCQGPHKGLWGRTPRLAEAINQLLLSTLFYYKMMKKRDNHPGGSHNRILHEKKTNGTRIHTRSPMDASRSLRAAGWLVGVEVGGCAFRHRYTRRGLPSLFSFPAISTL